MNPPNSEFPMENDTSLNKELTCILFPANVKNHNKAIQCLGGIKAISQVCAQPTKKPLTLSFQPENPYIKKINCEAKPAAGVLLKVKVKKVKENGSVKTEVLRTDVVGHVKKMYRCESMCDFQYLPVNTTNDKTECLLDEIIPSGLDELKFMEEPAPLYIVPSSFIRFDKPINYSYTDKRSFHNRTDNKSDTDDKDKDEVHKMRSERGLPVPKYVFNLTDELPTEPHEYYIEARDNRMKVYPQLKEDYETLKKMFDERPVWSFTYLKFLTKVKSTSLKVMLPCLALYNRTGPWKMMWVKLGYDPRKDPHARYYQTLDFRIRQQVTQDEVGNVRKRKIDESYSDEIVQEGAVCFRPNTVPQQRQIYYNYCDIHLPEVQDILAVEPPTGYLCHPKRGWLAPDTPEKCRDLIFKSIKLTLLENKAGELKLEEMSSGEDSASDDETRGPADTATDLDDSAINS